MGPMSEISSDNLHTLSRTVSDSTHALATSSHIELNIHTIYT